MGPFFVRFWPVPAGLGRFWMFYKRFGSRNPSGWPRFLPGFRFPCRTPQTDRSRPVSCPKRPPGGHFPGAGFRRPVSSARKRAQGPGGTRGRQGPVHRKGTPGAGAWAQERAQGPGTAKYPGSGPRKGARPGNTGEPGSRAQEEGPGPGIQCPEPRRVARVQGDP